MVSLQFLLALLAVVALTCVLPFIGVRNFSLRHYRVSDSWTLIRARELQSSLAQHAEHLEVLSGRLSRLASKTILLASTRLPTTVSIDQNRLVLDLVVEMQSAVPAFRLQYAKLVNMTHAMRGIVAEAESLYPELSKLLADLHSRLRVVEDHADAVNTTLAFLGNNHTDLPLHGSGSFATAAALGSAAGTVEHDSVVRRRADPVVAVVVATTSRVAGEKGAYRSDYLARVPPFASALPSLTRTAERGFLYRVYVVHDAGDPYFDSDLNLAEVRSRFETAVVLPLLDRGIVAELRTVRCENPAGKPGIAFIAGSAAAIADGAEYVYRINDDSEMITPWAKQLTSALAASCPPNVGAVGPLYPDGNRAVLTHDMVHRTHFEIFGTEHHYPPELTDWWLDDWISGVYGGENENGMPMGASGILSQVQVRHHSDSEFSSRRYEVDRTRKAQLPALIARDRAKVAAWVKAHGGRNLCAASRSQPS